MGDQRRPNLRPFTLYLNVEVDAPLIKHLDRFAKSNRASEEMRRMLEIALGQVEQSYQPPITQVVPSEPPMNPKTSVDIRKKMKGQF